STKIFLLYRNGHSFFKANFILWPSISTYLRGHYALLQPWSSFPVIYLKKQKLYIGGQERSMYLLCCSLVRRQVCICHSLPKGVFGKDPYSCSWPFFGSLPLFTALGPFIRRT